jgi:hypothetical protein
MIVAINQTGETGAARTARRENQGEHQQLLWMRGKSSSDKHPESSQRQVGKEQEHITMPITESKRVEITTGEPSDSTFSGSPSGFWPSPETATRRFRFAARVGIERLAYLPKDGAICYTSPDQ